MSTNRRFISFFLILIAILLFSCDNGLRVSVMSAQEDGRAYLFISTGDNSRTVFPEQLALDSDMSLSFELKGGLVGSGQTVLREWTATSSTAYVAMTGDNSLTVEAGEWNFTLEAKRNNQVILSASINSMDIVAGVNKLSFGTMEENRTSGTGTVDVTVKLPADSGVSHVGTGVLCVENGGLDDTRQELTLETGSDGAPFFRYYRENVESGSYSLMIQLTQDKDPNVKYVFREAVQVAANLTSSKTCSISSLSTVYSVTYNLNTTGGAGSWKGNSIPQDFYNPYDILVLPVAGTIEPPTGYFFGGWYEDSSFSGNPVTMIGGGSSDIPTGAKSFYAKWTQELYVGGPMASDANDGGNVAAPLATIQAAVDKIVAANDGSPYTILLMGDVRDSSSVAYVSGKNFSLVNIVPADTLNLTIKSNIDGTPRTIDAGRNDISTGRVMYVGAKASVTLQDVVVTGGYVKDTSGGGILATSTATSLTLSNCEVSRNTVENGNGGGLYVAHDPTAGAMELALQSTKVNLNTIIHKDGVVTYSGAGVGIENSAVELKISANSQIQGNTIDNSASIAQNPQAEGIGLWLGNSATTTVENTVISGNILTAKTGSKAYGGGIYVGGGELTLGQGANVSGHDISSASGEAQGGGIHIAGGQLILEGNVAVGDNKAVNGGGIAVIDGTLSMNGGEVSGNTATYNGGGVCVDSGGIFIMNDGSISDNYAGFDGGGVYVSQNATFIMKGGSIKANEVGAGAGNYSGGGGVYVNGGTFTMEDGEITQNNGLKNGGGVYVGGSGTLSMSGGEISSNTVTGDGGGVYVSADSTFTMTSGITAPKIIGNEAGGNGGGVYAGGTLNMNGGEISGNTATYNGGGIAVDGGVNSNIKASIAGGAIGVSGSPNTAENGGGIYLISGMVDISAADVSYNEVTANGGGIYLLNGSVTLQGGAVSNNEANSGGGVYVITGTTLEMTGGIISSNSVTTGRGGGINLSGTLSMTGGTISGNGSQGVYAISAQAINLGDSAVIAADNDIQLGNGKTITITSSLTGSAPVATISPFNYTAGLQVISAGYGVTLSHEVGKFDLSPGASGLIIDNTGKLGNPTPVSTTEVLTKLQSSGGSCSDTFLLAPDTTLSDLDSILTELYSTYNDSSLYQITLDLSKTTITEFSSAAKPPSDSTGNGLPTSMGLSKIILPASIQKINSTEVSKWSPFVNVDPSAFTVECIDPNVSWRVTSYMMDNDNSGNPIYTEFTKNETSTIESYYLTEDGSFRYVLEKI